MKQSPEITGAWNCPAPGCGNRTHFIGTDSDGYGGPSVCECGAFGDDDDDATIEEGQLARECSCSTELRQPVFVDSGDVVDYGAFTGGGYGAEIGEYDTIVCGECGALVWSEEPPEDK